MRSFARKAVCDVCHTQLSGALKQLYNLGARLDTKHWQGNSKSLNVGYIRGPKIHVFYGPSKHVFAIPIVHILIVPLKNKLMLNW